MLFSERKSVAEKVEAWYAAHPEAERGTLNTVTALQSLGCFAPSDEMAAQVHRLRDALCDVSAALHDERCCAPCATVDGVITCAPAQPVAHIEAAGREGLVSSLKDVATPDGLLHLSTVRALVAGMRLAGDA
jgi:hypothetical protein